MPHTKAKKNVAAVPIVKKRHMFSLQGFVNMIKMTIDSKFKAAVARLMMSGTQSQNAYKSKNDNCSHLAY